MSNILLEFPTLFYGVSNKPRCGFFENLCASKNLCQFVVQIFGRNRRTNSDTPPVRFIQDPARTPVPGHPVYTHIGRDVVMCARRKGCGGREDEDRGNGPLPGAREPYVCDIVGESRSTESRDRGSGKGPDFCTRQIEI